MPDDLATLEKAYFVDELGLAPDEVAAASQNLLGYFQTLQSIQTRLDAEHTQL